MPNKKPDPMEGADGETVRPNATLSTAERAASLAPLFDAEDWDELSDAEDWDELSSDDTVRWQGLIDTRVGLISGELAATCLARRDKVAAELSELVLEAIRGTMGARCPEAAEELSRANVLGWGSDPWGQELLRRAEQLKKEGKR